LNDAARRGRRDSPAAPAFMRPLRYKGSRLAQRTQARRRRPPYPKVAQLVEHVTENHGVAGSIPALGTT
jgi:hypothetical protein